MLVHAGSPRLFSTFHGANDSKSVRPMTMMSSPTTWEVLKGTLASRKATPSRLECSLSTMEVIISDRDANAACEIPIASSRFRK